MRMGENDAHDDSLARLSGGCGCAGNTEMEARTKPLQQWGWLGLLLALSGLLEGSPSTLDKIRPAL